MGHGGALVVEAQRAPCPPSRSRPFSPGDLGRLGRMWAVPSTGGGGREWSCTWVGAGRHGVLLGCRPSSSLSSYSKPSLLRFCSPFLVREHSTLEKPQVIFFGFQDILAEFEFPITWWVIAWSRESCGPGFRSQLPHLLVVGSWTHF